MPEHAASRAVALEGVGKSFGGVEVLHDLSLEVRAGEIFFLLGASGCGKTTLLRLIAGLAAPDRGRIFLAGEDVTTRPAHQRGAAMMLQQPALWPHLTVAENVAFGLVEQGKPREEIAPRVREALASVHLADVGDRAITQLSGGQQQRVALARALVLRPRCLLLDEPLAHLDAPLRHALRTEIESLCRSENLSAIYVSHDAREALSIADRVGILHEGRLVQVATPSEIQSAPASDHVAALLQL